MSMPRGSRFMSGAAATTLDADPGQSPTVLVMLAIFSVSPAAPVSAGKVRNVPPPATALRAPASPAPTTTIGHDRPAEAASITLNPPEWGGPEARIIEPRERPRGIGEAIRLDTHAPRQRQ